MAAANLAAIRRRLLGWYKSHERDLPWRRTSDPYAIWISETMLQQTQVSTVVSYYKRFMKAFPNVDALDRAPLDEVLALWSGLGYYRRAENLKKSARILARRHSGRLPDDYAKLRALPGIGEYTAGALLSIAFGKPYPAVDGNARRVIARLFMLDADRRIRDAAWRLMPRSDPGQFNQSLMDLGTALCIPQKPRCAECPVEKLCATQMNGQRVQSRTAKKKSQIRAVTWPLAILRRDGKMLLRRRGAKGMLAGLWEIPGGVKRERVAIRTALEEHLRGVINAGAKARCLGEIRHSITMRRIRAPVFLIDMAPGARVQRDGPRWRWVAPDALDGYPTSSMTRKALRLLAEYEKSHP